MALAYRSSATATGGGPVSRPAGAVVGDLLIASFQYSDTSNPADTPAGWTKLLQGTSTGGRTQSLAVFWRYDAGATSYTFTATGAAFASVVLTAYSGPQPTSPIAGASIQTYTSARGDAVAPAVSGGILSHLIYSGSQFPATGALTFATPAGSTSRASISSSGLASQAVFTHTDGAVTKTSTHENGVPVAATVALNIPNVPPTAPTVTAPNGGESYSGTHTVTWAAGADGDGDALVYDVELSRNNGGAWTRIGTAVAGLSLVHNFGGGTATGTALVRVRAVDPLGEVSPWDESNAVFTINTVPNAPSLGYPSGGQSIDRAVVQRFSWTHSDPNPGDTQSKYDLRYRVVGAPTWTDTTGTTTSQFRDVAASTFALGNYEWQVRTYDSLGTVGPYSSSGFFTAIDAPAGPSITAPLNGGTVGSNPFTVTWSAASQDAYQLRTVADLAGVADTGTIYTDTGVVESATDRSRSVAFPVNPRTEHVQLRVRVSGLWSAWTSNLASVSYTAPAVPILSIVTSPTEAAISVAVSHPTPTGSQPVVTGVDIYRRETLVGGDGIRLAADQVAAATFIDYTVASGLDYEYAALAYGTNETTTLSAWTGAAVSGVVGDYSGGY